MSHIKINSDKTACRRSIDIENGPEIKHWEDRYTFPADLITLEWVAGDKPSLVHVEGIRRLKSGKLGVQRVSQSYSFTNPGPVWPAIPQWVLDILNHDADFLATAIADPEGQRLATASASHAATWGKEWAVSVRSRPNDVGEASTNPADRDEMLTQISEWNSRHDAGAYLVSRTVGPWKEER